MAVSNGRDVLWQYVTTFTGSRAQINYIEFYYRKR